MYSLDFSFKDFQGLDFFNFGYESYRSIEKPTYDALLEELEDQLKDTWNYSQITFEVSGYPLMIRKGIKISYWDDNGVDWCPVSREYILEKLEILCDE
jgi:hypothetical protein